MRKWGREGTDAAEAVGAAGRFLFPLFLPAVCVPPGSLRVLDRWLPSPEPTPKEQLAEARICVAQPAPAGFLQPQETHLLGREHSRARAEVGAPGNGGHRSISQPSPWTEHHRQEKQPLSFNNLIII